MISKLACWIFGHVGEQLVTYTVLGVPVYRSWRECERCPRCGKELK